MLRNNERRDELLALYEKKSKETADAEKNIKKEINDLKEKIESNLLIKKRDNHSTNQSREKVNTKISNLEHALEKLKQEETQLQEEIDKIKKETDDNYQNKVSQFRKTVKPLEDTKNLVIEEREKMENKISDAQKTINTLKEEIYGVEK